MSEYVIVQAPIGDVHDAPWQPQSRKAESTALIALRKSIQDKNLQYPPLVTRNADGNGFTVVDGHRRLTCCRFLKWPTIPVLVASGIGKDLFAAVSGTTKPLTARQWVEVHLAGGSLPRGPTAICIKLLEELKGREFLQKLVTQNASPQIWNVSNRVVKHLNLDQSEKSNVLDWLLDGKLSREVSLWMTEGHSVEELRQAFVERRRPLPN